MHVRYDRVQVKSRIYKNESGIISRDFNTDPSQRRGGQRFLFPYLRELGVEIFCQV